MTAVASGIAFCLWVTLAAFWGTALARRSAAGATGFSGLRGSAAGCLGAAAFLFVPPGSLPPFCNYAWGGIVFLACLAFSLCLSQGRAAVPGLAVLTAVCMVAAWYARHRGMPGGFANLGTFAAMPLWSAASVYETTAFILLALAAVAAAQSFAAAGAGNVSITATVSFMAVCALLVTLFFPWTFAPHVDWPAWAVAGCDFILFWGKTACCVCVIRKVPFPRGFAEKAAAFCWVLGAALLYMVMD